MIVKGLTDILFFFFFCVKSLCVTQRFHHFLYFLCEIQGEKEFLTIKYPVQSALKGEDVSWRNISDVKSNLAMMKLSCCDLTSEKKKTK